ncbi:MAG: hypothetical protein NC218_00205 [Acetobacter sp.]|nr:hypothetical protein [Acetobacter sp.]
MPNITNIINQSNNPDDFKNFISNHFDELTAPATVSIGLKTQTQIPKIVSILRKNGINAAGYYNDEALSPETFAVDSTGIRTPLLTPQSALQATVDIYNILKSNNIEILGHALPQTADNFVYVGKGSDRTINITKNAQEINPNVNPEQINSFIVFQLSKLNQYPLYNIAELEAQNTDEKLLYRGGTLGNQPFAIPSTRRARDIAYGTPKFSRASVYATGAYSVGITYQPVNNKHYGFIYEFDSAPDQKYYKAYGIERGKQDPKLDNNGEEVDLKYETPLLPHRNKFRGIYLQYGDNDNAQIIKIAENGQFISPEWERFTKLHEVFSHSEPNNIMRNRLNQQKRTSSAIPYQKAPTALKELPIPQNLENYILEENKQTSSNNFAIKNLTLKSSPVPNTLAKASLCGNVDLNNISFPKEIKHLDLSQCTGTIYINNCDLSHLEKITFPKQCHAVDLGNNQFSPLLKEIDLKQTQTNYFFLSNQDLSSQKSVKFPQKSRSGDLVKYHIYGENKIPLCTDLASCTEQSLKQQLALKQTQLQQKRER